MPNGGNVGGRYAYKAEDRKNTGPLTDDEKKQVRECLASGLSVTQTARKVKVRPGQVTYLKRKEGLTAQPIHDNTAGVEAWKAISAQRRAERAFKMQRIFDHRSDYVLDVLDGTQKYKIKLKAAMGEERIKEIDTIPAQELQFEARALTTFNEAINKLDDKMDDQGHARAESMLEQVLKVAGAIVDQAATPRPGLIQE